MNKINMLGRAMGHLGMQLSNEEYLLSYADKNPHSFGVDVYFDDLKTKTNAREIVNFLNIMKSDILCIIRQKVLEEDSEYQEYKKLLNEELKGAA
jgi:hypothetical protein